MACGGPPSSSNGTYDTANELDLAHHFGQVSLDFSPMLPVRLTKPVRNYSLRELEIMATIGTQMYIIFYQLACMHRVV